MNGAQVRVYSRAKDGSAALSPHFKVWEFACHDGSDTVFISDELVAVLEQIRTHFDRPAVINSGYRTETHNQAKGGAAYSRHKYGLAADITVQGVAPARVAAFAETLLPDRGGIGVYDRFCHIDVRGVKSRWQG